MLENQNFIKSMFQDSYFHWHNLDSDDYTSLFVFKTCPSGIVKLIRGLSLGSQYFKDILKISPVVFQIEFAKSKI